MKYLGTKAFINQIYGECTAFYMERKEDKSVVELMINDKTLEVISVIQYPAEDEWIQEVLKGAKTTSINWIYSDSNCIL